MILRPLEHVHAFLPAIVDADERTVFVNRPRDRMTRNLEIGFDVAHELERILAGAVALVHEREDRNPAKFADRE